MSACKLTETPVSNCHRSMLAEWSHLWMFWLARNLEQRKFERDYERGCKVSAKLLNGSDNRFASCRFESWSKEFIILKTKEARTASGSFLVKTKVREFFYKVKKNKGQGIFLARTKNKGQEFFCKDDPSTASNLHSTWPVLIFLW